MAKLQILTQFGQLFTEVNQTLDFYNENLKNNLFQKDEKESNEKAYKRGEGIFDQFDENLNNINLILHLENEIIEFFNKCKENKQKLISHKNELITQLLKIKKECTTKEDYLKCRDEWNKKRIETPDERNRRECEEMFEEMIEEKKIVEEMTTNMIQMKEEIDQFLKDGKIIEMNEKINRLDFYFLKKFGVELMGSEMASLMTIKPNNKFMKQSNLTTEQIKQLEEWTELTCSEIIFDSNVDNWGEYTSVLNERIVRRDNEPL